MKIVVFGSTGMLGTYVCKFFKTQGYEVLQVSRSLLDLTLPEIEINNFLSYYVNPEDVIINASGLIKQRNVGILDMVKVNIIFPHILSQFKNKTGCNIIHISTDCVFSGDVGEYYEGNFHDCLDDYGKTKSLGEPQNLTIIRTSIIGEEINNKISLIEWCKSMKNNNVDGYSNHKWNGVTCLELCKYMHNLIKENHFWMGVRHVFSDDITKETLISLISKIFKLNLNITPIIIGEGCDRRLRSKFGNKVEKSHELQLQELKEFNIYE
jgi:dTDP-4-dehydrorhamnose reductase